MGQSFNVRRKRWRYLWLAVMLISVATAEAITALMELLLKGEITYDYLVTALVVTSALTPPVIAAGILMQRRLQELEKRRQEQVAKNLELTASQQRYRTLIEVANDAILVIEAGTGTLADCNRQAEALLNVSRDDVIGKPLENLYARTSAGDTDPTFAAPGFIGRVLSEGTITEESSLVRADGTQVPVEVSSKAFEMEGRRYIHGALRDITERKRAEERLRLLANAFEYGSNPTLVTDAHNRVVELNPAFTELTGYTLADLQGQTPHILSSDQTPEDVHQAMWESIIERGYWQGEVTNRRKDGSVYIGFLTISVVRDEQGRILFHLANCIDITQRREAEDQIRHLAHHDSLTKLPNRAQLHSHLEQAIDVARRNLLQVAVMFIDLDNFKMINDTLGHPTGDIILKEVARRLKSSLRPSDVVARLGGDEFVVVITGLEALKTAITTGTRILESINLPYRVEDRQLHSGASIGIAVYPGDGDNAELLMKNADVAMYHAKSQGRNNFQFFSSGIEANYRERLEMENDLRAALELGSFSLCYQPQVDLVTNRVCSIEALVRWNHPTLGDIPPARFIPVAEETKMILPLGIWVITKACQQLRNWLDEGLGGVHMAINVSVTQLQDRLFVDFLRATLASHGISGSNIELEITESAIMENLTRVQTVLKHLLEAGIGVAIDDFGTGYSSLGRLKLLPIQCLKIDRSFVEDIERDTGNAKICAGIIALAHSLGLRTVAEGVETEAQKAYLNELGCNAIQGYLIAEPLSPNQVLDFIWRFNKDRLIRFPVPPRSLKS